VQPHGAVHCSRRSRRTPMSGPRTTLLDALRENLALTGTNMTKTVINGGTLEATGGGNLSLALRRSTIQKA
jgi:hypothetical protein